MGAETSTTRGGARSLTRAREHLLTLLADPAREVYTKADLGPDVFSFGGRVVVREDFEVPSVREARGPGNRPLRLAVSWWHGLEPSELSSASPLPTDADDHRRRFFFRTSSSRSATPEAGSTGELGTRVEAAGEAGESGDGAGAGDSPSKGPDASGDEPVSQPVYPERRFRPVVLFFHAGTESRAQGPRDALAAVLSRGMDLVSVDFCNCGMSEGVGPLTLGIEEADDVRAIVAFVLGTGLAQRGSIGIWGHSLGAAAALQFLGAAPSEDIPEVLAEDGGVSLAPYVPHAGRGFRTVSLFGHSSPHKRRASDGPLGSRPTSGGSIDSAAGDLGGRAALSALLPAAAGIAEASTGSLRRERRLTAGPDGGVPPASAALLSPTKPPVFPQGSSPQFDSSMPGLPSDEELARNRSLAAFAPSPRRSFFPTLTGLVGAAEAPAANPVGSMLFAAEALDLRGAVGAVALDSSFASIDWVIATLFRGIESPPGKRRQKPKASGPHPSAEDPELLPRIPSDPEDHNMADDILRRSPPTQLTSLRPPTLKATQSFGKMKGFWHRVRKDEVLRDFRSGAGVSPTGADVRASEPVRPTERLFPQTPPPVKLHETAAVEATPPSTLPGARNSRSGRFDRFFRGRRGKQQAEAEWKAAVARSQSPMARQKLRPVPGPEATPSPGVSRSPSPSPTPSPNPVPSPPRHSPPAISTAPPRRRKPDTDLVRQLVVKAGAAMVKVDLLRTLRSSLGQDRFLEEGLDPRLLAPRCAVPAIFGRAESDEFLTDEHLQTFLEGYGGRRSLISFAGGHFDVRPALWRASAADFLKEQLTPPNGLGAEPSTPGMRLKARTFNFNMDWITTGFDGLSPRDSSSGSDGEYGPRTPVFSPSAALVDHESDVDDNEGDELDEEDETSSTGDAPPADATGLVEEPGSPSGKARVRRRGKKKHKYTKSERRMAHEFYHSQREEFVAEFCTKEGSLGMRLVPIGEVKSWAVVLQVQPDGQAETNGVRARDVIMKVGDIPADTFETVVGDLQRLLRDGQSVPVTFARQRKRRSRGDNDVPTPTPTFSPATTAREENLALWESIGPLITKSVDVPDIAIMRPPWDVAENPLAKSLNEGQADNARQWRRRHGVAGAWMSALRLATEEFNAPATDDTDEPLSPPSLQCLTSIDGEAFPLDPPTSRGSAQQGFSKDAPASAPSSAQSSPYLGRPSSTSTAVPPGTPLTGKRLPTQRLLEAAALQDATQSQAAEKDLKRAQHFRAQAETAAKEGKPHVEELLLRKAEAAEELAAARRKGLDVYAKVFRKQQAELEKRQTAARQRLHLKSPIAESAEERSRMSIGSIGSASDKSSKPVRRRHSMLETSSGSSTDDVGKLGPLRSGGPSSSRALRRKSQRRSPGSRSKGARKLGRHHSSASFRGHKAHGQSSTKASGAAVGPGGGNIFGTDKYEGMLQETVESDYDSDETQHSSVTGTGGTVRQSSRLRKAVLHRLPGGDQMLPRATSPKQGRSKWRRHDSMASMTSMISLTDSQLEEGAWQTATPRGGAAATPRTARRELGAATDDDEDSDGTREVNVEALTIFDILDAYWLSGSSATPAP